jgi:hypothetical protein
LGEPNVPPEAECAGEDLNLHGVRRRVAAPVGGWRDVAFLHDFRSVERMAEPMRFGRLGAE